jgi:tetratricopeptide (TPR) repeat protein
MFKSITYIIYVNLLLGPFINLFFIAEAQINVESYNERYLNCVNLAREEPKLAEAIGKSWKNSGGGLPARHCISLANANMGFYKKAALELEALAGDIIDLDLKGSSEVFSGDPKSLRVDILTQAGNAWLLANKPNFARDTFSKALAEFKGEPLNKVELLIDRSHSFALLEDYEEALGDLEEAQLDAPGRADIFVFKASAKRFLKRYDEAVIDIELALFREPKNREGLLERGNLRRTKGNIKGATKDWNYLISLYPNSEAAKLAQKNLESLQVEEAFKIVPNNDK